MAPGPIRPTPDRPGRRERVFAPTHLLVFQACPEQYYRRFIGRERMRQAFGRGTLRGSAVHKVLADAFRRRRQGELVDRAERSQAERYLPMAEYRRAAATGDWEADVAEVVRLAQAGLARIPNHARVLDVERSFRHMRSPDSAVPGVELVGHVDLVVEHRGGIVEHIEFKTGFAQPSDIQDVICRIGVCEAYGGFGKPILSTTLQLSTGDEFTLDGDRDVLRRTLGEIERTIRDIWGATTWPARVNDRCVFCTYRDTLCSIHGAWSAPNRLAARET